MRTLAPYPSVVRQVTALVGFTLRTMRWIPAIVGFFIIPLTSLSFYIRFDSALDSSLLPLDAPLFSPIVFYCLFYPGNRKSVCFICTRPLDKKLVLRTTNGFAWLYVLLLATTLLSGRWLTSPADIRIYGGYEATRYLESEFPGAIREQELSDDEVLIEAMATALVTLPNAKLLFALSQMFYFLETALLIQLFLLITLPLRVSSFVNALVFFAFWYVPLFVFLFVLGTSDGRHITFGPMLFVFYVHHQLLLWSALIAGIIATQIWTERLFIAAEIEA